MKIRYGLELGAEAKLAARASRKEYKEVELKLSQQLQLVVRTIRKLCQQ